MNIQHLPDRNEYKVSLISLRVKNKVKDSYLERVVRGSQLFAFKLCACQQFWNYVVVLEFFYMMLRMKGHRGYPQFGLFIWWLHGRGRQIAEITLTLWISLTRFTTRRRFRHLLNSKNWKVNSLIKNFHLMAFWNKVRKTEM